MADICFIIFLLGCGALYIHLRLARWTGKYKHFVQAMNWLLLLTYVPLLYNYYWKTNARGAVLLSSERVERLTAALVLYIVIPVLLLGAHIYLYRQRAVLPRAAVSFLWPSLLIPAFNIGFIIFCRVVISTIHDLNYLQIIANNISAAWITGSLSMALYLIYLIYLFGKIDNDYVKLREGFLKLLTKVFSPKS